MFTQALRSLSEYRLAALLSGFGIAVGIASTVVLLSLVSGFELQLARQLRFDGRSSLVLRAERPLTYLPWWDLFRGTFQDEFVRDTTSIRLVSVEGELGSQPVVYSTNSGRFPVRAIEPGSVSIRAIKLVEGRLLANSDLATEAAVAVVGAGARRAICGNQPCLGEYFSIAGWQYRIIGSVDWIGERAGVGRSAVDREIYIPFSTAMREFSAERISPLVLLEVKAGHGEALAERAIRTYLTQRGLASADFEIRSGVARQESAGRLFMALRGLGVAVGSLTLTVGIIGVVNVMLLSVRSRAVEIGIRRALGATRMNIFIQFLSESLMITSVNGLLGLGMGWGVCRLISLVSFGRIPAPVVSISTALFSLALISACGVIAGVSPARRAAAVYPAVALRSE